MKYFHTFIVWLAYLSPLMFYPLFILPIGERYEYGVNFGTIGLLLFILTLIPSIIQRFGLAKDFNLITKLLIPVRRQLGILMFMAAFTHYLAVKVFPILEFNLPIEFALFEIFGLTALILLTLLFLTSNNQATRLLKQYWKHLHRLTYLIGWLIFGHIVLIGLSPQSIVIGVVMVMEMASLGYSWHSRRHLSNS